MSDFITFLINFAITYFLMRVALAFFNISQEAKELQKQEFRKYLDNVVHAVKEEQFGDQIYWFDLDKESFITQGKTRNEIIENLKKYYNDHIFILDDRYILSAPDWVPIANKQIKITQFDK